MPSTSTVVPGNLNTTTPDIDDLVTALTAIQTDINGILDGSYPLDVPQIHDASEDHQYIVGVGELAADRTITLPVLAANDEFVFKDHTQTLTNKTLTAPTISGVVGGTITSATITTLNSTTLNGTLGTAAQPNVTSVGTLTGLAVSGDIDPSSDNAVDLGNGSYRFKDGYFAGSVTAATGSFSGALSASLGTFTGTSYPQVVASDSAADSTPKNGMYGATHYDTDEEKIAVAHVVANSTTSKLNIGGGTSVMNAATQIDFITAANNTTTTGTVRMSLLTDGMLDYKKAGSSAGTPGNFSADNYMTMKLNGTTIYVPYMTSTW